MGKFDGVLIATDLDGTLLNDERKVSDVNRKAIDYFTKNGGYFTVSTGRSKEAAEFCILDLPINAPVVLMNGAVVYDYAEKKLLHMTGMDCKTLDMVKQTAENFPELGIEIFLFDKVYICQPSDVTRRHFEMLQVAFEHKYIDEIETPEFWCKVNFTQEFQYLNKVREFLNKFKDDYSMSSSASYFYEVTNKNDNKGTGVLKVADTIGANRSNIYTIGDNFNDLSMLEISKISFAPSNAEPEILKKADIKTSSNNEHALNDVITYLDKIY